MDCSMSATGTSCTGRSAASPTARPRSSSTAVRGPGAAPACALISLEPNGKPGAYSDRPAANLLAFVRICAHYFSHGAWLPDDALLRGADRLAGIPGMLIHGRLDLSSPLDTAWTLHRAWPDSELAVIDDSGHTGSDAWRARIRGALDTAAHRRQ